MDETNQSPVMVGCCPSSGSTLLSVILDAHSKILCGNELNLFSHPFFWKARNQQWRSRLLTALVTPHPFLRNWTLENGFVPYINLVDLENLPWYGYNIFSMMRLIQSCNSGKEFADKFWKPVLKKYDKDIWVEKSPPNLYSLSYFLEAYPEGRGIVIVRDGRDVVCSLKKRGFSLGAAISNWLTETTMSLELSKFSRVLLVKYEDLVFSTQPTMEKITRFLGVESEIDRLLDYTAYTNRNLGDARESVKSWKQHPGLGIPSIDGNRNFLLRSWKSFTHIE
jgi:hypothetical protein